MNVRPTPHRVSRLLRDRRGAVLVMAAISMTAVLGAAALSIDVGLLYTARGEAQRAADAAALAGAGSFIQDPGDEDAARELAEEVGEMNVVRNEAVEILPDEDIVVDVPNERVTVTVRRLNERGNGVPAFFARIFGVGTLDVDATATAEAIVVGTVSCVAPFSPPDAWNDVNADGKYNAGDSYATDLTGYGSRFRDGVPSDNGIDPPGTTYERDWMRPIVLKEGTPHQVLTPSQYFPITLPEAGGFTSGADDYVEAIVGCNEATVQIGDHIPTEPGRMRGPTAKATRDLIAQDPGAHYDPDTKSIVGSRYEPWRASPRVIHLPLHNPESSPASGRKDIEVANVTAFWVESIRNDDVIGRFMFASGVAGDGSGGAGGSTSGPGLMAVRLIR